MDIRVRGILRESQNFDLFQLKQTFDVKFDQLQFSKTEIDKNFRKLTNFVFDPNFSNNHAAFCVKVSRILFYSKFDQLQFSISTKIFKKLNNFVFDGNFFTDHYLLQNRANKTPNLKFFLL